MSTVAWDGTTLAGDRLSVRGDTLPLEARKVFGLHDGQLFGGVGLYDSVLKVLWWFQGIDEKPVFGTEDHFSGILVKTTGEVCLYDEALVPKPILEPFFAIGSGRDFALAAMALGQNAIEAIELAKRFDVYTGMGTDHYVLGGHKMSTSGIQAYYADMMAAEMTRNDPRVKAVQAENMAKMKSAMAVGSAQAKNMTGAKCKTWSCQMSANYGGMPKE